MPDGLTHLFNTIRYLRSEQVGCQIRNRVHTVLPGWLIKSAAVGPDFPGCRSTQREELLPPPAPGIQASDIERGVFRFLNTTYDIGFPPRWEVAGAPRLWLYNLHYFDWLWSLDFGAAQAVVLDWIERHENRRDRIGWESYPISVRLVNWCGFFFGRHCSQTQNDKSLSRTLWQSIYRQSNWLSSRLETHLLNNHYLENGAALAFTGSCFAGDAARRWCERGRRILAEQLGEQVLSDGMHFELSPMYHSRVLYVLSLLLETEVSALVDLVAEPVRRMARTMGKLCHPDGDIALLSDSAFGICHEPGHLQTYSQGLLRAAPSVDAAGGFALPDGGYYGWRGADGTYLIADFGKIGPNHNPGHGHADMFSFELSLKGHRVITDSGVHDYEDSDTRRYCRSTAAHNTVEIDGQDQCELWGAFRVARRGRPRDVVWRHDNDGFTLTGWHDGYKRLPGRPIHRRQMQWHSVAGLMVHDRITARRPVRCVSRLHLHPTCRIAEASPRCVKVSYPAGTFRVEATVGIEIEETPYFPRFYETKTRPCLWLVGDGSSVELKYRVRMTQS